MANNLVAGWRTLANEQFRRWPADYVGRRPQAEAAAATVQTLKRKFSTGGRRFHQGRDE